MARVASAMGTPFVETGRKEAAALCMVSVGIPRLIAVMAARVDHVLDLR